MIELELLTDTQVARSLAAAKAMTDLFGVSILDFEVIQGVSGVAECPPTVAYVARMGIDLGDPDNHHDDARSWTGIRGPIRSPVPEAGFVVNLGDEQIDTRKGMTEAVYRAMIAQNPHDNQPDHPIRHSDTFVSYPFTLLTGESAKPHWAPAATVRNGQPALYEIQRSSGSPNRRFRPAVLL